MIRDVHLGSWILIFYLSRVPDPDPQHWLIVVVVFLICSSLRTALVRSMYSRLSEKQTSDETYCTFQLKRRLKTLSKLRTLPY
jgi:hypothetical protein